MSSIASWPRWRVLLTPRWLGWHGFAVAATIGMLWLGDWQFHRAESGNALSWAYTFEWPVFAIFGAVFWAKTIRDELKPPASNGSATEADAEVPVNGTAGPGPAAWPGGGDDDAASEPDDPELAAYNAYLARLNERVKGHGR